MAVRIVWESIRSRLEGSSINLDEPFLFVLPQAGRQLLLSLAERLEWEATYRVNDYDYSDWDELQSLVSITQDGLLGGESVNEIQLALQEVAAAISALKLESNVSLNSCCASGGDDIEPTLLPTFPVEGVDPVPEDYVDWDDFDDYRCRSSTFLVDYWIDFSRRLATMDWTQINSISTGATVALEFGAAAAFALGLGSLVVGVLAVAGAAIALVGYLMLNAVDLDGLHTDLQAIRDDMICALVEANNPDAAMTALFGVIDAGVSLASNRVVMSYLIKNDEINATYERHETLDQAAAADCSNCGVTPPQPSGNMWLIGFGTVDGGAVVQNDEIEYDRDYTVVSEFLNSSIPHFIQIETATLANAPVNMNMQIVSVSGWSATGTSHASTVIVTTTGSRPLDLPNATPPPTGTWLGHELQMTSATEVTMVIRFTQ